MANHFAPAQLTIALLSGEAITVVAPFKTTIQFNSEAALRALSIQLPLRFGRIDLVLLHEEL